MKSTLIKTLLTLITILYSIVISWVFSQQTNNLSRSALENATNGGHLISSIRDVELTLGGFIEADVMHDLKCQNNSSFFRTSEIKVPNSGGGKTQYNVADTRLRLGISNAPSSIKGVLEIDFRNSGNTPRIRHAYIEYNGFGVSQYWSNFADNTIFPNLVINTGGPNSLLLVRQPQIRYHRKVLDTEITLTLEENKFDVSNLPDQLRGRQIIPDLTASFKQDLGESYIRISLLANPISYSDLEALESVKTAFGLAVNLTGNFKINNKTHLKFQGAYGTGFSHYVEDLATLGLEATTVDNKLSPLELSACWLFIEHTWNKQWDSTIGWGYNHVEDNHATPNSALKETHFGAANLSYKPTSFMRTALELIYGQRINYTENNDIAKKGENVRLQFTTIFRF